MSKTYLPQIEDNNCIVVDNLNSGYIRVYDRTPTANSDIDYIDYFIDKDYITRQGTQSFGNYSYSVNCQPHDNFTTDFYYRVDLDKILIIFIIFCIFCIMIPLKIFTRLFRRFI